ncbi:hypothetical protein ASPACDRAFT_124319 [Aspergillus aculeatus ATCC 16872]|uniref:Uncharacterized protein n=1 Tax=Aspergillus aculeatus (strain ATCC 16872 / CBS 172.66 / WB 5094) TaxID=690307 RepID=A0A1L9WMG0_ASPA1|nr:uncharacterized protein ASPACDRAFT_124319 [Aspergillus aculeatus ATCC 16872]OJJ97353.1 hypothetical protein ASPACDRAFT_124319 [Aspergillus aculeatus ATCC 16872]
MFGGSCQPCAYSLGRLLGPFLIYVLAFLQVACQNSARTPAERLMVSTTVINFAMVAYSIEHNASEGRRALFMPLRGKIINIKRVLSQMAVAACSWEHVIDLPPELYPRTRYCTVVLIGWSPHRTRSPHSCARGSWVTFRSDLRYPRPSLGNWSMGFSPQGWRPGTPARIDSALTAPLRDI